MSKLGTHYQVGENETPMYKVDDYHSYNRSYLKPYESKKRLVSDKSPLSSKEEKQHEWYKGWNERNPDYHKNYYQNNKDSYKKWFQDNKEQWLEYRKHWSRTDKGIELKNKIRKLNPQRYQWSEDRMIDQIEENGDYCSNTIQLSHYSNDPIDLDHFSIETY